MSRIRSALIRARRTANRRRLSSGGSFLCITLQEALIWKLAAWLRSVISFFPGTGNLVSRIRVSSDNVIVNHYLSGTGSTKWSCLFVLRLLETILRQKTTEPLVAHAMATFHMPIEHAL